MAQAGDTTLYNTLIPFLGEYGRVTATAPEDRVGAMWSVILSATFPVQRFAIESQSSNPGGYTDFTITDWCRAVDGELVRRPFFVVETKSHNESWPGGREQLERYLKAHHITAAAGQTGESLLYGAVARGAFVKFFTYNRVTSKVRLMHNIRRAYEVNRDAVIITSRLWEILSHH